uniref:Centrosomal protein of 104 kDa n=1 Tax=Periophthalmus magnuspinnatus TaxID=409849 RepID=A0A3B4B522_9GOBI
MPRKIAFIVVNSSSHEEKYSAQELKVHAPTAKGWRSSRLCSYPQTLTLELEERSRVRKLQLLAHQYMIPSRVDFHIGDSLPTSSPLHKLGYVSLSDNQQTAFKARELKSVHVDSIGTHLRITLHENHANPHNRYNQVSAQPHQNQPSCEQLMEQYLGTGQREGALDTTYTGKCESFCPLDDLAFDMYQDPEVAQLIRLLHQRKQEMVHHEKFEKARLLKQALADLHKVGERLAWLEVEKRCALEKEDYEQAEHKRQHMEHYRSTMYRQLEVHQLLEPTLVRDAPYLSPDHTKPTLSTDSERKSRTSNPQPHLSPEVLTQSNPASRPILFFLSCFLIFSYFEVPSVPYDERPLPALLMRDRPVEATLSPPEELSPLLNTPGPAGIRGEPEPLTKKAQREAGHALDVFGETIVCAAYSKTWSYREDALVAVQQRLREVCASGTREELRGMVRAAVLLLQKSLQDKVSSVFQCSLKLLLLLLSELILGAGLGRAEVTHCLEQTWPYLLRRMGDACNRLRLVTLSSVQEIALLKDVRTLQWVPCELVKPISSTLPARLAQSRAELLERLLSALGTNGSGFTLDNVMMFCTGALSHSAPGVREAAVRIILSMYQQHGAELLRYLPPNDHATRTNFIYKKIFDGFAQIDGELADAHVSTGFGELFRPQELVQSNQEQLATLKEITVSLQVSKSPSAVRSAQGVDTLCIFCGRRDEGFTEDGLDRHYWKHCPMLRLCDHCKQVVEISSLTEHLLGECESQSSFSQCPQCSEAVPFEEIRSHMEGPHCNPPIPGKASNHCPLCHTNFQAGDEVRLLALCGHVWTSVVTKIPN